MDTNFTIDERNMIKSRVNFLIDRGFEIIEDDDKRLCLKRNEILISIYNAYHDEPSDISIRYLDIHEIFFMGGFALVNNPKKNNVSRKISSFEDIMELIDYIEKNFNNLTNIRSCLELDYLVDDYLWELSPNIVAAKRKRYTEEELQELEKIHYKSENKSESFFKKIFKK